MHRALLPAFALLVACGPVASTSKPSVEPLAAFELTDVNPASRSAGQQIGPVALRGKVSGWYFTHTS